jgi:hypothetical protein
VGAWQHPETSVVPRRFLNKVTININKQIILE